MYFQIDKGHAIKGVRGAVRILDEVNENRKIGDKLIELLKNDGHKVEDISCNESYNVNEQLINIVEKANKNKCDLVISIHLNAGGGNGTETYVVNNANQSTRKIAEKINNSIVDSCNFTNRGLKEANFFVLRKTISPAILIEVCFVDSYVDSQKFNSEKIAMAIFFGLTGKKEINNTNSNKYYRVVIGSFKDKNNALEVQNIAKTKGFRDCFITSN